MRSGIKSRKKILNRPIPVGNTGPVQLRYLPVKCGVLQDSILGPILFFIYVNDRHQMCKYFKTVHNGDDTALISNSNENSLQIDLDPKLILVKR